MEAPGLDQSPKKGDPVLTPTQSDLKACLVSAFRRDVSEKTTRWEGQHAAFPPETGVSAVDEIKIYWPLLTEFVRSSAYGLQREMCLQELESGPLLPIPVGEYPDLNNVKQHSSLQRTRSASMKALFGFGMSSKGSGDDDDGDGAEGGGRGRSPSGKVIRRISTSLALPGNGTSPRTSEGGSPKSTALRKALVLTPSLGSAASPDGSPLAHLEPLSNVPPQPPSFASSLSSKLRSATGGTRGCTKYTLSYLSFRRRIVVESVSPLFFRDLTRSFDERASYLQDQPGSLLPRVIAMLRLSQQPAGQGVKQKRKAYFVLSALPFPMENHSQVFSLCLRGSGGGGAGGGGGEGGAAGGDKVGAGPYSEGLFLSDGDVCREHELLVDSFKRVEVVAQLASDLGHLQRQGRTQFAALVVATCRDPVLGALYRPGAALGPEDASCGGLPLCDRPDLPARHDLPRGAVHLPEALLPVPTVANSERPQWEYYLSVHESTDGGAGSSWAGWFTGRVGVHEQTSRLLRFLQERLLLDGGGE